MTIEESLLIVLSPNKKVCKEPRKSFLVTDCGLRNSNYFNINLMPAEREAEFYNNYNYSNNNNQQYFPMNNMSNNSFDYNGNDPRFNENVNVNLNPINNKIPNNRIYNNANSNFITNCNKNVNVQTEKNDLR